MTKWMMVIAFALMLTMVGCLEEIKQQLAQQEQEQEQEQQEPGEPLDASITLDLSTIGRPVNRLLLGNNLQWVDNGDEILARDQLAFDPVMEKHVRRLSPTVLRYPGGSQASTYHWREGTGSKRGTSEHFHNRRGEVVRFGTLEFLELCRRLNAEPLITVNVASGTAEEAADWVAFTNKQQNKSPEGKLLPKVKYWEIGNEPYLKEDVRTELAIEPKEYAKRANRFIVAMKKVDPSIVVGIPLRSDKIGGVYATPFQGYADIVLKEVTEKYEFVAVHNAYMPFAYDRQYSDRDLYLGAMSSVKVVEEDMEFTRSLLKKYRPRDSISIAVTEYNSLFSLDGRPSDGYISSLAGAIYVADALRLFAGSEDILMANYWSLTGNGWFGALSNRRALRPTYYVLVAYQDLLRGNYVPFKIEAPSIATPKVGLARAQSGISVCDALVTRDQNVMRLILLNKSPGSPLNLTLGGGDSAELTSIVCRTLSGKRYFDTSHATGALAWTDKTVDGTRFPVRVQLDPHSVTYMEFRISETK